METCDDLKMRMARAQTGDVCTDKGKTADEPIGKEVPGALRKENKKRKFEPEQVYHLYYRHMYYYKAEFLPAEFLLEQLQLGRFCGCLRLD